MIKDKIVISSVAGILGTLCKDLPNYIYYKLGIIHYLYAQLAASAHLEPKNICSPLGYIIGFLADIATGGAIGIAAILFLDRFGIEYWWYKGLAIGITVWLFGLGVILNLGTVHLPSCEPLFRLTSLFDHLIFGVVVVYIIGKWQKAAENYWK
ncbi:MAG TPA: hypothetical protein DDW65_00790 [Firmicutes bacterium]|jgi:hypothetical protein|nr:hypothetical protein [Bacillota bacterium]